ncbi:ankyrin repeat domain-containing protein [Ralstonia mojiangensis]|uniref:ankyrin repeat domain-containing protein n=1 Tax=Ralstonia mojiangensis TaxID=2953895 RepID=UPI0037099FBF
MEFDLGNDLFEACAADDIARVREVLLASLPSCVAWKAPRSGWTPLHAAADSGSLAVVECLIAAGADPNSKSGPSGDPPLQVAIHSMFTDRNAPSERYAVGMEIAKRLLAVGADANIHGGNLCSALGLARLYEDDDLITLFGRL